MPVYRHLLMGRIASFFFLGCLVTVVSVALPVKARASSILAAIHETLGFGQSGLSSGDVAQQIVSLSYGSQIPNGPGGLPFLVPAFPPSSPCLGCGPAPSGFTGTTDYTPANTAEFNDLTSRLTNGIDEVLQLSDLFYPSLFGGALLTLESSRFDLQGDTIDFIRRVIFSNTLTIENVLGVQETLTNVDVSWEIWGASQVPEPGTLILLSIGLVSLGMMRRLTPSGRRAGAEPLRSAAPDRRGTALESAG